MLVEAEVGEAAVGGRGGDEPLVLFLLRLIEREEDLAVGVGILGEVFRIDAELVAIELLLTIAEEFDVGFGDRLAGDGVGDEVKRFVGHRLADDRRVGEPEDDAARCCRRPLWP